MKNLRLILCSLLIAAASLLLGLFSPKNASAAYDVSFANVPVGQITPGSGHVGVDIWWPANGSDYNPCHGGTDMYYGACATANSESSSYYKSLGYSPTGTDFPYGIFIDNQNSNNCLLSQPEPTWCQDKTQAPTINHGWATLITGAALEIYPDSSDTGAVRVGVGSFPNFANGGRYSANVGNITLPQIGQSGIGKLNGFVTKNGVSVSDGGADFAFFQNGYSLTSSTGYPLNGFAAVHTNGDGYYSSGPVPNGSYQLYVTDNSNGHKILFKGISISTTYDRLDFQLDQPCFGHPGSACQDPAP